MSARSKGYVDAAYLDAAAKLMKTFKQLTYERMRVQPGQRILDLGCGPATDTIPLGERYVKRRAYAGVGHSRLSREWLIPDD